MNTQNSSYSASTVAVSGSHRATFSTELDSAMGVEPEAAWLIIAELHTAHGYSAWYDLGVIAVIVLGVGTMYLTGIQG